VGWSVTGGVDPVAFGVFQGRLEAMDARLERVENTSQNISEKVDAVLVNLAEKRGERRVAVAMAGFLGSMLGLIFGWLTR
jgi:hypothetical protein